MPKTKEKKALMPELRFPEFEGEWSETSLKSISTRIRKKVGEKKLTPVSITAGVGFVDQTKKFGRRIAGAQYKNYIHVRRGDFVYNKGNSKTFAQGCIYQLKEFDEAAASTAFICFKLDEDCIDHYFRNLFECNTHGKQLRKFITSGARSDGLLNINPDDFFSIQLPIPPTKPEQQKIADCLDSLDELIAARIAKLAALQDHKKGLLQQLFPAPGQTIPKLRFPGFEGEWEETTWAELVTFKSGGTPAKSNQSFWNGDIPWVTAKDMKEICLSDTQEHISEEAVKNGAKIARESSVLILVRGMTLFKDLPIVFLQRDMSFNQDVKALWTRGNADQSFLPFLLLGNKAEILEAVDAAGHGTGRLNMDDFKSMPVCCPTHPEQQKIADCLSSLDALITAEADLIAALKQHKRGLMQKLFPNPERSKA
ncbi:restriction endonuclease subunit S [Haloferula sargassicola]|uniref:Type I restriction modification DNA specificity domain-containing protein n=1 Tax=Haloferula sargassicola TaxID=490096 RepID=A0ABP9URV5_9BACT